MKQDTRENVVKNNDEKSTKEQGIINDSNNNDHDHNINSNVNNE